MDHNQISLGDLIANIYARFERSYGDEELACVATEVTVNDIVRARWKRSRAIARELKAA